MTCAAFIPIRSGSKGIPHKNIKEIAGHPLCYWAIKAANDCIWITDVFVSTDSLEYQKIVDGFGFEKVSVVIRDKENATDDAQLEPFYVNFFEKMPDRWDYCVLIQATSPLLQCFHLDHALYKIKQSNKNIDSMLSVVDYHKFRWGEDIYKTYVYPSNYSVSKRPRRQDLDKEYFENGAFYIIRRDVLINCRCRLGRNIGFFCMPKESLFEIDEPDDFRIIESLLIAREEQEVAASYR